MTEALFFIKQMELVFNTLHNKRRGHDSLVYENNIIALTVRAMDKRLNRTLRIEHNYVFLTSLPKWREIMATEFEGRKVDHEVCDVVMPLADRVLSPYTYNNRVNKGSWAAIKQLCQHIKDVSLNYTLPTRIIKIDFKSYFPNALWSHAELCINTIIDNNNLDNKDYLKWLTSIAINCDPAHNCELKSPKHLWEEHIKPEKSIFNKPHGVGAAIGRLVWLTAMGLYINDIIKWLTEELDIKLVCFVDDIVMVVPEDKHEYILSLIPILREKLAERNVFLNEKKFYDLPYLHGLEFLGSHIKPHRGHLNNRTFNRAIKKIKDLNNARYKDIDAMLSSFNSYSGLLKNRVDYKRLILLRDCISSLWWKFLEWNENKKCLSYKDKYSINSRLCRKYNIKLRNNKHK